MTYKGKVQSGVVVFLEGPPPPDGTVVTVVPSLSLSPAPTCGDKRSIWEKLADLGRQVESEPCDLPADLAANHDYYLHGLPKRQ